jgi:tetratricopeptide (TPR) repeat protein
VHTVITKDTHLKGNLLPIKKSKMDIRGFVPGDIYLSKSIYDDIRKQRDMSLSPPPIEHRGKVYYKFVKGKSAKTFPEQRTANANLSQPVANNDISHPVNHSLEPCFYCGSRDHNAKDCPSKSITEITNTLNEAGYFSPEKLNSLLPLYQATPLNAVETLNTDAPSQQDIMTNCFYELKCTYQLRFFRTIWESKADFWERAKKNISVSEGGFAWLALDSFRVSNYGKAETYIKTAQENNTTDYKPYCIMSFLNIERNNFTDALKDLDNALTLTRTNPQKMFIYFLQSRIYTLLGNTQKAQEKISKIVSLDPGCAEATYEDIILKLKQDKDTTAMQRLARLIIDNRKYYVAAFIDPDLKPYDKAVNEILTKLFNETKTGALSYYEDAKTKVESVRFTLTKQNTEDIQLSMNKIENMITTDSYFGYLDVSFLASSVISICNNTLREQKKNLSETITRINKRLDQDITALLDYRYPRLSANCLNRLKYLRSKITNIDNINAYSSTDQFEATHRLCAEITREAQLLELVIKKLDIFQQMTAMSLSFLKHSSIFFSIVFFVGIFLFPFFAGPINTILAKLDISSIPNSWSFQKAFLISGGILSLIVSFLITAKKNI